MEERKAQCFQRPFSSLFLEERRQQTGQTGYNEPAVQQREKQSWRGVEVFILASPGLTVIYWEFDPLSSSVLLSPPLFQRASTPPCSTSVVHARVELIKASLILGGG